MASTDAFNSVERAKRENGPTDDGKDGANTRERNRPHSNSGTATKWGLIGGVVLGVLQLAIIGQSAKVQIGYSLYGIFALTPFIYLGLREYRSRLAKGEVFKNGAILGFTISAIAGGVMMAIVLVGALAGVGSSTEHGSVFANISVLGFMLVLMAIVYGSAITFVLLQGMKSDAPADENIEKVEGHA